MKKENAIILLIVAILCFALLSWSNTKDLHNQINQLKSEVNSVRNQISHEVSSIKSIVEGVREDARWWGPGQINFSQIDDGVVGVQIDWYLKEYWENSQVTLNYRLNPEDDYVEVAAMPRADGYYMANILVEIVKEPIWHIYTSRTRKRNEGSNTVTEEEVRNEEKMVDDNMALEYYIVVKKEDMVRSTDVRIIGLHQLRTELFHRVEGQVHYNENTREVKVDLFSGYGSANTKYELQSVTLEKRSGDGEVIESWNFEEIGARKQYHLSIKPEDGYEYLYIVAEYSGGLIFEREISAR